MKNNVGKYSQCYGCGVCSVICPKNIIEIKLNSDGFLTPFISDDHYCIECGLCLKVCSYNKDYLFENYEPIASYGGWSNNVSNRYLASSGGIAGEISKIMLGQGYYVCAVDYNTKTEFAHHFIADKIYSLSKAIGSKYIQSQTLPAFASFERGKKYLVIGTPCQIDTLRRFSSLKKCQDQFIFIDFFCHGTPSYLAWKKYLEIVKGKIGSISFINWRNKLTGWHDSWAIGANTKISCKDIHSSNTFEYYSRLSKGDIFYNLFLGDYCMNPACCKACKYKYDHSCADIRIGDFWGKTYKSDEEGVSAIVSFTELGEKIMDQLKESCTLINYPFKQVAEGQMKSNAKPSILSPFVMKMLRSTKPLNPRLLQTIFFFKFLSLLPKRIYAKLKSILLSND